MKAQSLRFGIALALILSVAFWLTLRSRGQFYSSLASIPSQINSWKGTDLPFDQKAMGPGEFLLRLYQDESQPQSGAVTLFVALPKRGQIANWPDDCVLGRGWMMSSRTVVRIKRPNGASFSANRFVVSKGRQRQLVISWFQSYDHAFASVYLASYYQLYDTLCGHRNDGATVQLTTSMFVGESPDDAQVRVLKEIGSRLLLSIDPFIPH
ncbi:MAG: exosortase C-terminal domain/associated protein EpsI [Candidatus Sulfotelmatobacter sp.]